MIKNYDNKIKKKDVYDRGSLRHPKKLNLAGVLVVTYYLVLNDDIHDQHGDHRVDNRDTHQNGNTRAAGADNA